MRIGEGRAGPNVALLLSPIKRSEVLVFTRPPCRRRSFLHRFSQLPLWMAAARKEPRCCARCSTTNNKQTNHDSAKKAAGETLLSRRQKENKSINELKTAAVTQQGWIRAHLRSILHLGVMIQHIWHFEVPPRCEAALPVQFSDSPGCAGLQ